MVVYTFSPLPVSYTHLDVYKRQEQQAFWRKAGKQLLDCLEGLPALQRAAFLLHHEDGLSLDEMTRILDAEFETVKSRLRYALSKLRACMGAYLPPAKN